VVLIARPILKQVKARANLARCRNLRPFADRVRFGAFERSREFASVFSHSFGWRGFLRCKASDARAAAPMGLWKQVIDFVKALGPMADITLEDRSRSSCVVKL
jgi:hypothetical protein